MSATEVPSEVRRMIDARLDVIDRVLIRAELAWSERQSIVGEVETQIFELLARRGGTPTQQDVTEVLDSLDPPESYLPEGAERVEAEAPVAAVTVDPQWRERVVALAGKFGTAAAWTTGLLVVNGAVIAIVAASEGTIPWLVTLGCLVWANYAGIRRFCLWSAEHRGHLVEEARKAVASWLLPKDGAPAA